MVKVEELDSNEEENFKEMQKKIMKQCDKAKGTLYVPTDIYRDYHLNKKAGPLYGKKKYLFLASQKIPDDPADWPINFIFYLPNEDSDPEDFNNDYVRCWFVYFYQDLLPTIYHRSLFAKYDWLYPRVLESIENVAAACIYGVHYDFDLRLKTAADFAKRSKIVLDVIRTWAPMEFKPFLMAKIPRLTKNNQDWRHCFFVLPLTMFELAVASLNKALSESDECEVVDRILDYIFKGENFINVAEDCILQSFFRLVEVSRIAEEHTIKRLVAGKKDLNKNDKMVLFCFNESKFSLELFNEVLVKLLKPDVALASAKSRREAKRVMLIMTRILKCNELNDCEAREFSFIQPGKYLIELASDKTLQQDAEKLSSKIAERYPTIVPKINDTDYEVPRMNFAYHM